jgi:isopenicillin-N epimerase
MDASWTGSKPQTPEAPPTERTRSAGGVATKFGRAMLAHWALDPAVIYLNHGTVGAVPRRVLEAQQKLRDAMERQPSQFVLRELTEYAFASPHLDVPRMRTAARAVAEFLGARGEDLVFVDNATTGVNAVLGSFDLREGDEVLILDGAYGAVNNTARFVCGRRGATLRVVELPYPVPGPGAIVGAVERAIGPRTRLAILDHIMSESALLLPLAEMAAVCRARGVAVLVDGAHAPGAIPLDIPALGVDWYVGNLHKWAQAPRSSGILWAPPARQAELHPTVISWGLGQGFTVEFDLVGTRDPSPHLAAPEGIAFMRDLGLDAMRDYNHALAWEAARLLTRRWGTEIGKGEDMVGVMVTVPLPARAGSGRDDARRMRDALLYEDGIEVQMHAWRDRVWARVSAQVYNELADVERLARAVEARLA